MTNEPSKRQETVSRLNSLLPALVQTLNADNRLPWAKSLSVEDVELSLIPVYFVTSDAAHTASAKASNNARGHSVNAGRIGTRLIVTQTPGERTILIGDLSYYNKEDGTLGIASIEFDDSGALRKVNASHLYRDGEALTSRSNEYVASAVTVLMMEGSEHPASGMTRTEMDGVDVYEYKQGLDADSAHQSEPVQYSPRTLPRMRNELAKEFKHFFTRPNTNFNKPTADYFKEIAENLEDSNELWWVSEDMSKLAWDVAMSGTEPEDLSEEELPAPNGIMWLNGGGGPALLTQKLPDGEFFETGNTPKELLSINAIAWYTPSKKSSGIPGLEINKPRFMGLSASPQLARDTTQWGGIISPLDVESNLIDYFRIPTYVTFHNLKFLPRKLALIVMRLAREEALGEKQVETLGGATGSGKKRSKDKKIETITCALLRKRQYSSEAEREAEAREYSHRWIVRGHMRNQPVGPRNVEGGQKHERVWIAPYIKGPEDKPLILKDRVQVWR